MTWILIWSGFTILGILIERTSMTTQQLTAHGALYFENLQKGLGMYPNCTIKLDAPKALDIFQDLWKKNGQSNSFVDFYYFTLSASSKKQVVSRLTLAERQYLDHLTVSEGGIIFPLDEMLLSITVKLNADAMLFSTFYFTNPSNTWWGNYNQEYIVFEEKENISTTHFIKGG